MMIFTNVGLAFIAAIAIIITNCFVNDGPYNYGKYRNNWGYDATAEKAVMVIAVALALIACGMSFSYVDGESRGSEVSDYPAKAVVVSIAEEERVATIKYDDGTFAAVEFGEDQHGIDLIQAGSRLAADRNKGYSTIRADGFEIILEAQPEPELEPE